MKSMQKRLMVFMMIMGLLATLSCKKSSNTEEDPADASLRLKTEKAAGYSAATISSLCSALKNIAMLVHPSAGNFTANEFSYNPATGWWSFQASLSNGQSSQVKFRFIDVNGNVKKYPDDTVQRLQTEGTGSGPNGSFSWDLDINQISVHSSSGYIIVDGDGTAATEGISVTWSLSDVHIDKLSTDIFPESGTMTLQYSGITIKITFNGSETVTVTYSYKGLSYTFKINLTTGQITR